ncbi:DNA-3-methyladenine glycosylase I [Aliiglaciecola sp. 3_MG-2023]|uniref:DNA-3-methyladenine glycosylase I n=1 Tax=Aliiglaciecola sp. 3_MG-2023 TaxID=3062644 RepID=UPI0026E1CD05|nr:DNA-3-methyladenine glycosylase I [Aliiglaciecola sp. 3_MG-2023]MDO6695610.1 DNA-3-methyladenine glycosylase I [Aliiglaciecola sp. 3_MG-2023]
MDLKRCSWAGKDPIYQEYHDKVWGIPVYDPKELFAKLCLDGQQAGLSWITILKKQQNYEAAFHNFEPTKIVLMGDEDVERLMLNKGIVRNRLKIKSIINNAHAFLKMQEEGIEFADFIWSFVDHRVIKNHWRNPNEVPTSTPESDQMAKALKKKGFSFVGTTICYAFMQAVGLVNDHTTDCHCYKRV